jgi:hypothetical protein
MLIALLTDALRTLEFDVTDNDASLRLLQSAEAYEYSNSRSIATFPV